MKKISALLAIFCGIAVGSYAQSATVSLDASSAYVVEPHTGTVLLAHNEHAAMPPASLAKLMTAYLLFDALKKGTVTPDSELPVSEKAWRMGGSKMFVSVGKTAKISDLIPGILTVSGNDACVVVAEYLAGSEEAFATLMTQKAAELGMTNTVFKNASGWPDPDMHTSAYDMSILATRLIQNYPEHYQFFSLPEFTYNNIKQPNRNGLLDNNIGVDGLKTGHTEEAGYHLVSSAQQNGLRIVSVVMGTKSPKVREQETQKVLRNVFGLFEQKTLVAKGMEVEANAPVWLGTSPNVKLVAGEGISVFRAKSAGELQAEVSYTTPLMAPLAANTAVGMLTIKDGAKIYSTPIVVATDVPQQSFFARMAHLVLYNLGLVGSGVVNG